MARAQRRGNGSTDAPANQDALIGLGGVLLSKFGCFVELSLNGLLWRFNDLHLIRDTEGGTSRVCQRERINY